MGAFAVMSGLYKKLTPDQNRQIGVPESLISSGVPASGGYFGSVPTPTLARQAPIVPPSQPNYAGQTTGMQAGPSFSEGIIPRKRKIIFPSRMEGEV